MNHTLFDQMRDALGGTPMEVLLKMLAGASVSLFGWAQNSAWPLFAYFVLVILDAMLGLMLAKQERKAVDFSFLVSGPGKKILSTSIYLFGAAIIQEVASVDFVVKGLSSVLAVGMFFDAGRKYGKLTGSDAWRWIEDKLGNLVPPKKEADETP